jgi:tetratricopeptide (TPR) repeat protein
MIIANSSDLIYPVKVREVQGDWLQIWVGNRVVSTGWILRSGVCTADEAIGYFTNEIALNQNVQHALHMRSLVYVDLGREVEAIQDATTLVGRWPSAFHYTVLGNRLESAKRYDEALVQFGQALAFRPNNFWARHARAALWIKLDRWNDSLNDANLNVAYHPRHASGLTQRAKIWRHMGQFANAAADYEAAIRINPENPDIANNLAWLRATCPDAAVRNGPEALVLARNAVALARTTVSDCLETLAAAHAENGQFAEALKTLQQSRDLKPQQSVARRDHMQSVFEKNEPFRDVPLPPAPVAAPIPHPDLLE